MGKKRKPFPSDEAGVEYVEVTDQSNRPLAVLSHGEAHRQGLRHRSVLALLYDREHKLLLKRRDSQEALYPSRWDIPASGPVKPGESAEEAVCRELDLRLEIKAPVLKRRCEIAASPETGFEFVTIFYAFGLIERPGFAAAHCEDGLFVNQEELRFLVERFRDQLAPGVVFLCEKELIYPARPALAVI